MCVCVWQILTKTTYCSSSKPPHSLCDREECLPSGSELQPHLPLPLYFVKSQLLEKQGLGIDSDFLLNR